MQIATYAEYMKHLIVGIDPGKTAAIACIDLDGKLVYTSTSRFAGIRWFIENIKKVGSPVVIAGDRKNADTTLRKLSSIFNAVLFTPEMNVSVEKKQEMTDNYSIYSLHERDAIAAAKIAYNSYSNKLNQAGKIAKFNDFKDTDKIKALVIKKYSIKEVLSDKKKVNRFIRSRG